MKKILYNIALLLAVTCAFIACNDDDGPSVTQTPAKDVAGTYEGEWVVRIVTTQGSTVISDETYDYVGEIELSENESSSNYVNVDASCADAQIEKSGVGNIFATSTGSIDFVNKGVGEDNPFGAQFTGFVKGSLLKMTFDVIETSTIIVKGRPQIVTKTSTYNITGTKQ